MMILHSENHIKRLRLHRGMSTEEAARCLKITKKHLQHIEQGVKRPSAKLAYRMSRLYGTTMDEILRPYYEGEEQ